MKYFLQYLETYFVVFIQSIKKYKFLNDKVVRHNTTLFLLEKIVVNKVKLLQF